MQPDSPLVAETVLPVDYDQPTADIVRRVMPFTMTPPDRVFAACHAARYIVRAGVKGAVVECGVWRGGSMMAMALALLEVGDRYRHLYLYDTFEGMTAPDARDHRLMDGRSAADLLSVGRKDEPIWAVATLEEVRDNLLSTGYPMDLVHFVPGPVEQTLPAHAPQAIAVLRLDTDWYASTKHELEQLFPRIAPNGVLIVDDYGCWAGARQAVDQYLAMHRPDLLLHRTDECRVAVVTAPTQGVDPAA